MKLLLEIKTEAVLDDLKTVFAHDEKIGMELNQKKKSEWIVITSDQDRREEILAQFRAVFPYIASTLPEDMTLLVATIGQKSEISEVEAKLGDLKRMWHRLETLPAHVAFFLLKNCFYIPKLLYMFRTAPVYRNLYDLTKFDTKTRQTLERIINIEINEVGASELAI